MKYKNYYNFELGNRDIYSKNDILGMTVSDLFKNELPLSYQYYTIGVPKDEELQASPNTHQYTDANGKLRWRSSSKTTEELLEEERRRRAEQQAQTASTQSQLSTMAGNLAPVNNTPAPQAIESPITDTEPLFDNASIQAMGGLINKAKEKLQNRKTTDSGIIRDSINDVIFSENPIESEFAIMQALQEQLGQIPNNPLEINEMNPNYLEENMPSLTEDEKFDINELLKQQEMSDPTDYSEEILKNQTKDVDKTGINKNVNEELQGKYETLTNNRASKTNESSVYQRLRRGIERAILQKAGLYPFVINELGQMVLQGGVNKEINKESIMNKLKNKIKSFQETGFNKEDDLDLKGELKDKYDKLVNNKTDYSQSMTLKEKLTDGIIKSIFWLPFNASSDVYTDGMTNFSRAQKNPNAKVLENMESLDESTQKALSEYGVDANERGVYYNADSKISKKFAKSPEVKKFFKENEQAIKQGQKDGDNFNFDVSYNNLNKLDRYASLQHAKMIGAYYDENGKKHGRFIDNVDFERRYSEKTKDLLKTYFNNHGYNMQEKGNFENYYLVMDILLDDTIDYTKKNRLLQKLKLKK